MSGTKSSQSAVQMKTVEVPKCMQDGEKFVKWDEGNMVRNYIKKTNRAEIDENAVAAAINDIVNKNCSYRSAATTHGVHFATLQYRMKKFLEKNQKSEMEDGEIPDLPEAVPEVRVVSKYATKQVFTHDQERMLEEYLIRSSKMQYGLSYKQLREFAFQYGEKLKLTIPTSWTKNNAAGIDWTIGFMKRHPQLSLRKAENTSLARASSFNKTNVSNFFDNYERALSIHKYSPDRILNIDESGITTVMTTPKVIAKTGTKQVGQTVSAERGQLVTFIGIVDAAGNTYPPVYIFPRVNRKDYFTAGGPKGSLGLANISGWVNGPNFFEVIKHVQKLTNATKDNPILILFDNHESHCTLESIMFGRENGMTFLTFPPHCSHKLQPLDVGVFAPFKAYCKESFNTWISNNPGKTISIYKIAELTRVPYEKAFIKANIKSGFRKAGLWPKNRIIFNDEDFLPSYATDRPVPSALVDNIPDCAQDDNFGNEGASLPSTSLSCSNVEPNLPVTDCQSTPTKISDPENRPKQQDLSEVKNYKTPNKSVEPETQSDYFKTITPESVRPFPKASARKLDPSRPRGREPGKSRILTETPEKNRIEHDKMVKLEKEKKKAEKEKNRAEKRKMSEAGKEEIKKRKLKLSPKNNKNMSMKKNQFRKKLAYDDSESSCDDESVSSGQSNLVVESDEDNSSPNVELIDPSITNLDKNDFILVEFQGKKSTKYFVGQIQEKITLTDFEVKFLRKTGNDKFNFPLNEDVSDVMFDSVVAKLPPPTKCGGTERALLSFSFDVDLTMFNIG